VKVKSSPPKPPLHPRKGDDIVASLWGYTEA
jgi:hypothetical protein